MQVDKSPGKNDAGDSSAKTADACPDQGPRRRNQGVRMRDL